MNSWYPTQSILPGLIGICLVGSSILLTASKAYGQILPDTTLGAEASWVNPGAAIDLIEGGATRGSALFHSFTDFNVNAGQQVYFANPTGIDNILSRVTGLNHSQIDGVLGVTGSANLFLINPNGIVFGPDASLDVEGAFLASTSDRFQFADGTEFRATNPNAVPLVNVNIPLGIQLGPDAPAALVNEADLAVGQDLSLVASSVNSTGDLAAPNGTIRVEGRAGNVQVRGLIAQTAELVASEELILEESHLVTDGDLTLTASQTVRIRDSAETPFLAVAGGDLRIQGDAEVDILALNHPQTPLQSGGNMILASDGPVSGDAHFFSWGNFAVEDLAGNPGQYFSYYDPVISVNGDVTLGNYTGVALKVEATGSIFVDGRVTITGPDTTFVAGGAAAIGNVRNLLNGDILITNESSAVFDSTLENFLDIDALDNLGNGNATRGSGLRTANISLADGDSFSFSWNFLTDETSSTYNDFAFGALIPAADTGAVVDTLSDISMTNPPGTTIATSSFSSKTFNRQRGNQNFAFTADSMTAGDYVLVLGVTDVTDTVGDSGLLISNATLSSDPMFSIDVVQTSDPDLPTLGSSSALILRAGVDAADIGNPGSDIVVPPAQTVNGTNFTPPAGAITDPDTGLVLPTASILVNGGLETTGSDPLYVQEDYTPGPIILTATGDIVVTDSIDTSADSSLNNANSGSVIIRAAGDVTLRNSSHVGRPQGNGSGGNVTIEGSSVTLQNYSIDPASLDTANGNSGNVLVTAINNIALSNGTIFGDNRGAVGSRGGNITLNGNVINLDSYRLNANNLGSGEGGSIFLNASQNITIQGNSSLLTNNSSDGTGGDIVLTVEPDLANTGQFISITNSSISARTSSSDAAGIGGDITVDAADSLTMNNSRFETDTSDEANGGDIRITADVADFQNGSQISTSAAGSGSPGSIDVDVVNTLTANDSAFQADTSGDANGGFVSIDAGVTNLQNGTRISTNATGDGNPGIILIDSTVVELNGDSRITSNTDSSGGGSSFFDFSGTITFQNLDRLVVNNSFISASTRDGEAGNIFVNAAESVTLNGVAPNGIGGLVAEADMGVGEAGSIRVDTPQLTLENGASIQVSSVSTGDAGVVTIDAANVTLNSGSQISATTESGTADPNGIQLQNLQTLEVNNSLISSSTTQDGVAGGVTVDATNSIRLSGMFNSSSSGISAAATGIGGVAGSVTLNTSDFRVQNGAAVTVSSPSGQAGTLTVMADQVNLDRGTLSAVSGQGVGGANITIDLSQDPALGNFVHLQNESLLSANALGNASGGNIEINTDFIFGDYPTGPLGSDIVANAQQGNGGIITVETLGIFGLEFRPEQTPFNDITANSQTGLQGTVIVNTLAIDPTSGLADLDFEFVDASDQTFGQCSFDADTQASEVTVAGRGGLPIAPTGILGAVDNEDDWVTLGDINQTVSSPRAVDNQFTGSAIARQPQALCRHAYQASQQF